VDVDVLLDPSRFLQELPDEVSELVTVKAELEEDDLPALEGEGRYQLPGFLSGEGGDDEVN